MTRLYLGPDLVDEENPLPVQVVQSVVPNTGINYTGFESITVGTTAVTLVIGEQGGNTQALITVEDAAVRFRLDGVSPTASVGHVIEAGDTLVIQKGTTLSKVRFIRRDGVDATLRVSYGV